MADLPPVTTPRAYAGIISKVLLCRLELSRYICSRLAEEFASNETENYDVSQHVDRKQNET